MIANSKKQISDSFLLGAILALAGGFLDAYTYLCRGGVFANAETGNIVLMGIKLANGSFLQAAYYLVPIMCFSAGALSVMYAQKFLSRESGTPAKKSVPFCISIS